MHYFCTYFDHHFLDRGLALYHSLRHHGTQFTLWVLCMDPECHDVLTQMHLPAMEIISMAQLESRDRDLLKAKNNRSPIEYYFTCTPCLPLFVLRKHPEIDAVTYLDADLFFFQNPEPVFEAIGDNSIAIIPHGYPSKLTYREKYGIYNVGLLFFKRDEQGLACLRWWRKQCLEWCYLRVETGRFADQKYLDDWPRRFRNVAVLKHKGFNLATWNMGNYHIHSVKHQVMVDEQPLVFFHFQGFRQINRWLYDPNSLDFRLFLTGKVKRMIFHPYIHELARIRLMLAPHIERQRLPKGIRGTAKPDSAIKRLKSICNKTITTLISVLTGNYVFVKTGSR